MKYIVIIGDGMADRPLRQLGGKTPLEVASTPNMDRLAKGAQIAKVKTIPDGFPPGSDVANLSILGYDPRRYYSGRAPLEAASMGVKLNDNDIAFRCNLVTLRYDTSGTEAVMEDYSAGHISSEEASDLIKALNENLGSEEIRFYPGVSYRHLVVIKNGPERVKCVPPHDIMGCRITEYLPSGEGENLLRELMQDSVEVLKEHPVNQKRIARGQRPANSIWLWGQGRRPSMPTYRERYGLSGALVSAVDLTKGIGIYAGFEILQVPGLTGWIDTNYTGKAEASLQALNRHDFVYIHVEAPDEAGHSGDYKLKIKAIEDFDALVVGTVLEGLSAFRHYRVLLGPDHPTPIEVRTHTPDWVPFLIYDSQAIQDNHVEGYSERLIERDDIMEFEEGYRLMDYLLAPTLKR